MDANGCVVPPDTKELVHKGEAREVYGFIYSTRLRHWFVEFGEFGGVSLGACTMPDSWERLLKDLDRAADATGAIRCACSYLTGGTSHECDKCKYHEKDRGCAQIMLADVARRIRELGEADDAD